MRALCAGHLLLTLYFAPNKACSRRPRRVSEPPEQPHPSQTNGKRSLKTQRRKPEHSRLGPTEPLIRSTPDLASQLVYLSPYHSCPAPSKNERRIRWLSRAYFAHWNVDLPKQGALAASSLPMTTKKLARHRRRAKAANDLLNDVTACKIRNIGNEEALAGSDGRRAEGTSNQHKHHEQRRLMAREPFTIKQRLTSLNSTMSSNGRPLRERHDGRQGWMQCRSGPASSGSAPVIPLREAGPGSQDKGLSTLRVLHNVVLANKKHFATL